MKQVVISQNFSGFKLPPKTLKRYAELKGKNCFFFHPYEKTPSKEYKQISIEECKNDFWDAFTIPNPEEYISNFKPWEQMSEKERKKSYKRYSLILLDAGLIDRDDPDLIKAINETKDEFKKLNYKIKIINIPNKTKFYIDKSEGGLESIHEEHKIWY